jgi:hypothetical protein
MAFTVRLTPRVERTLNALARRRGQTRSEVVREAIEHYAAAADSGSRAERPYDLWADVVGIVRTGGRAPDRTTGELFTELVRRKARARRAR